MAVPNEAPVLHSTGELTTGQVISGGVESVTTIVLLHVELLPQSSVAVHIRVTLKSHWPGVVMSVNEIFTMASHPSVAVASPNTGVPVHSIGDVTEGHVITGGIVSCMIIDLLQLEVFPQSSVAVQVRVIVLSCGHGPLTIVVINDIETSVSQASVAVAGEKEGLPGQLMGEFTVGQIKTGGVLSSTTMVLLQVAVFPHVLVAVHVLIMIYSCIQDPGRVSVVNEISTSGSHASIAIGDPNTAVDGHEIAVITSGHVSTGGEVSTTEIV